MTTKMVDVFGNNKDLLQQPTHPENQLNGKNAFLGMSFSHESVPIDILGLLFAGEKAENYSILLVDEFMRLNGSSEIHIADGLERITKTLETLGTLYGLEHDILLCSEFMRTPEYKSVFGDIEKNLKKYGLMDALKKTIPEHHRNKVNALKYPLNEIACVEYLRINEGIDVKIGPPQEKIYDELMNKLGIELTFTYTPDAYSLDRKVTPIVPYTFRKPKDRQNNRLFFEDSIITATNKLEQGASRDAMEYFLKMASHAGNIIDGTCLTDNEIHTLNYCDLQNTTKRLVLENIITPYNEAVKNGF